MGTLRAVLVSARVKYLEGHGSILGILQEAAEGDGALVADALEALDRCTPHPWTFSLYVCGAYWTEEGDVAYGLPRPKEQVLPIMGKACQRAARLDQEAA